MTVELAYLFAALLLTVLALGFALMWLDEKRDHAEYQRRMRAINRRAEELKRAVRS